MVRSLLVLLLLVPLSSLTAGEAIPSYSRSLEGYYVQQARDGGPQLTTEDRQIMSSAQQQLAAEMPTPGLTIGDIAPDFSLPNAGGEIINLHETLRRGPVILVFYRGAWCPFCNLHLNALHKARNEFERLGASVLAVTPQTPDRSRGQIEKQRFTFEILSDLDDEVMKDYGLLFHVPTALDDLYKARFGLDIEAYNGPGRTVLPVPATYIIDRKGIIRARFVDTDYKKRMEPADIIESLQQLRGVRRVIDSTSAREFGQ